MYPRTYSNILNAYASSLPKTFAIFAMGGFTTATSCQIWATHPECLRLTIDNLLNDDNGSDQGVSVESACGIYAQLACRGAFEGY